MSLVFVGTRTAQGRGRVEKVTDSYRGQISELGPYGAGQHDWGYMGAGPANLAYTILLLVTQDTEFTRANHQAFKEDVISTLPYTGFELPLSTIRDWVRARRAAERTAA